MIALLDGLPALKFDSGRVVAFRTDWLVNSLAAAAARAGYPHWWLAEHVAESVVMYLRDNYAEPVIPVARLARTVTSVLQVIGYGEVASHFVPEPPPVRVCLAELARHAGSGYELAFFDRLGRQMDGLIGEGVVHFEFTGLEPCVKFLRSRKTLSRDCRQLQCDIVAFVRQRMDAVADRRHFTICIS